MQILAKKPQSAPPESNQGAAKPEAQKPATGLRADTFLEPSRVQGKTFRYSVCLGRVLQPNEASKLCNPQSAETMEDGKIVKTITGGHQAPYAFQFRSLPKGMHLDGNGVISGKTADLGPGVYARICVIQLNEDLGCKNVGLGSRPPAEPPDQAKSEKPGHSAGKAALEVGTAASAAVLAAKAYQDYKNSQASSLDSNNNASNKWDGTYRATRTSYSCTPKSTCGDLFPEPGCAVSPFTFTVSGGAIRDNCGNFPVIQIPSNGVVSIPYFEVRITGTWSTSTFVLQGTGSSSLGTYSVTFSITKQ